MATDSELLTRYRAGSQEAFRDLVERYTDLVYSACLRQLRNASLAEDAAQATFLALAQKGAALPPGIVLAGWLFNAARFASAGVARAERRRRKHEEVAATMRDTSHAGSAGADHLPPEYTPVLDAALGDLRESDRNALLLKYFQNKSLAEIGNSLNVSTDAAQKRIERGLDKLKSALLRRNVTATETALAGVLLLGVQPAPAGLSAKINAVCSGKVAASAAAAVGAESALSALWWAKAQGALATVLAVLSVPAAYVAFSTAPGTPPAPTSRIATRPATPVFQAPLGIPAPEFGIDETVAGIFGDNGYFTHYVDASHPAANDDGNARGTAERPRRTLPEAASLQPGDVVQLAGDYAEPYRIAGCRGTPERPIFFRAKPGTRTALKEIWRISAAAYVIVEDLNWAFGDATELQVAELLPENPAAQVDHVALRGLSASYQSTQGNDIMVAVAGGAQACVIARCRFTGPGAADGVALVHGVTVQSGCRNIWVVDCAIAGMGGHGITVGQGKSTALPARVFLGRNTIERSLSGIFLEGCRDVVASENKINAIRPVAGGNGAAIVLRSADNGAADGAPQNAWLLANALSAASGGIRARGVKQLFAIGNRAWNIHQSAEQPGPNANRDGGVFMYLNASSDVLAAANFCWDTGGGIVAEASGPLMLTDNVVGTLRGTDAMHLAIDDRETAAQTQVTRNLFYQANGAPRFSWGSARTNFDLSELTATAAGAVTDCRSADPRFDAPGTGSFQPAADSPAAALGLADRHVRLYQQLFGVDLKRWSSGMLRFRPDDGAETNRF